MRTFFFLSLTLTTILTLNVFATPNLIVNVVVMVVTPTTSLDFIVMIIMENHPLNYSTNANGIIGNPNARFINALAANYSLATNYWAVADGSLPNYLALTNANATSVSSNCTSPGPSCSTSAPNIVDSIEASGRSWKAYMEDYSGGCNGTGTPLYAAIHNPFLFYSDITSNSTRCAKIVSANPGHSGLPDSQLISDLGSTMTSSNYMWLTPNNCDNMHDAGSGAFGCSSNLVANGDTYLSHLVPSILNSTIFKTQKAALFITFDEPGTSCSFRVCPVPTIWAGPTVKLNYASNARYIHYSLLATIESFWKLQPLTVNDTTASVMSEFLR